MTNKRRRLIGALAAGVGLSVGAGCKPRDQSVGSENCQSSETFKWKMVTAWPRNFPGLGTGAEFLAQRIMKMSGGRIQIKVYGAGELIPAFEVFDAVSSGSAQIGHAAAYYWKGVVPEAQFFGAVPFGMNAMEMNAWLYHGGGLSLWNEVYLPHNLVVFPAGQTGVQMGGWFNKEIKSVSDIKGLVMRIPGLGGEVLSRSGGTPQILPGAELFTALQTGTIDATEWVSPYNDLAFGLHQAAQFYYYPGWHEPTACLECMFNKQAFDSLPEDLQSIVEMATMAANQYMLSNYVAENPQSLQALVEQHNVTLKPFPREVLEVFKSHSADVIRELGNSSVLAKKIYDSYRLFAEKTGNWLNISELAYLQAK